MAKLAILFIGLALASAAGGSLYMSTTVTGDSKKHIYYLFSFGVCLALFFIFSCLTCCFWKQIQVAIAVLDATADFFAATKRNPESFSGIPCRELLRQAQEILERRLGIRLQKRADPGSTRTSALLAVKSARSRGWSSPRGPEKHLC